jgi:hypothetical protein
MAALAGERAAPSKHLRSNSSEGGVTSCPWLAACPGIWGSTARELAWHARSGASEGWMNRQPAGDERGYDHEKAPKVATS